MRHGVGIHVTSSGHIYDGAFEGDEQHGEGLCYFLNGKCKRGTFVDGKLYGQFVEVVAPAHERVKIEKQLAEALRRCQAVQAQRPKSMLQTPKPVLPPRSPSPESPIEMHSPMSVAGILKERHVPSTLKDRQLDRLISAAR
jgi:hypothetical protein